LLPEQLELGEKKMNEELESLMSSESGYVRIKDVLICWGKTELTPDPKAKHTATFSFDFPRLFARGTSPTITTGVHLNGNGQMMDVYKWTSTQSGFKGRVGNNHTHTTPITAKITMNYMAIGKAR